MAKYGIILCFLQLLLIGCRQQIELELPEDRRLVILSEINPSQNIYFHAAALEDLIHNQNSKYRTLNNLEVALLENGQQVDILEYDPEPNERAQSKYISRIKPVPGNIYSLEGRSNEFENFSCNTKIPPPPQQHFCRVTNTTIVEDKNKVTVFELDIELDLKNEDVDRQYFEIGLERQIVFATGASNDTIPKFQKLNFEFIDFNATNLGKESNDSKLFIYDNQDKMMLKARIEIDLLAEIKTSILINLKSINQDYFNFHKDILEQSNATSSHDGLFFNEPFFIHNNIVGGVGIFSGYTTSTASLSW